jgi:hypothetical protein
MDEHPDIGGRQCRLFQHGVDAVEHALFRGFGGGQDLAAQPLAGDIEHDIGEGAADIGRELDVRTSRHERSFNRARKTKCDARQLNATPARIASPKRAGQA